MTELDNDHFEIELAKSRITLDLPIQIGYFILQYAKLRMLEFYYDCLDKFCNREDFELMSMDTDSYYMSIAGDNLTDIVKPDMRSKLMKKNVNGFRERILPKPAHMIAGNPVYSRKNS